MSASPLVSVVVPVYNIEDYVSACLDSILAQTYSHLEIIIVDDGSTDGSATICDDYAKQDRRVRVIHQHNAGLSAARNAGLKLAQGEYICFIDGDDTIAPTFVEALLAPAADIAICEIAEANPSNEPAERPEAQVSKGPGEHPERNSRDVANTTEHAEGGFATANMAEHAEAAAERKRRPPVKTGRPDAVGNVSSGKAATIALLTEQTNYYIIACNKLYARSLFTRRPPITYPAGQLHEDSLTTYKLLARAQTVACLTEPLYHYTQRPSSIMNQAQTLARLRVKEQAAREAIAYFKSPAFADHPELVQAAQISLLLAHFSYLDAALRHAIPAKYAKTSITWLKSHAAALRQNPYLPPRPRLYLKLLATPGAFAYKLFRKFVHA